MEDYDDLGSYNGDVEHDMWVDYDHYQNTGEPDVFDEEDIDEIVDELNDWDWWAFRHRRRAIVNRA